MRLTSHRRLSPIRGSFEEYSEGHRQGHTQGYPLGSKTSPSSLATSSGSQLQRPRTAVVRRKKRRRRLNNNSLLVHRSLPKLLPPLHASVIRQWLRTGDLEKLEHIVIEGQGHKLLTEHSADPKVRKFLKAVPAYLARIDMVQEAVTRGRLDDLKLLLSEEADAKHRRKLQFSKNLALCRDPNGSSLLHKSVSGGHLEITEWLIKNYPSTVHIRDKDRRTALHFAGGAGSSVAANQMWATLVGHGSADQMAVDRLGHTPAFYMDHPDMLMLSQGSPTRQLDARKRDSGSNELVVKPSNIRIWIHDRDLGRLQQVLWEGHGDKLLLETSHHPLVKRFLSAVPYIMGTIREVHTAAIDNDVIILRKNSQDPIPRDILRSRDSKGLTPLHKASGLGNEAVVREILLRCPESLNLQDKEGRTALHFAATLRDDGHMYALLKQAGAREELLDKKGRPPGYYQVRPKELLDNPLSLRDRPDAPRTASILPPSWDWRLLQSPDSSSSSSDSYYDQAPGKRITTVGKSTAVLEPHIGRHLVTGMNGNNNGDSAFEDMGVEEGGEGVNQRFIDTERGMNGFMGAKNDHEHDEGVEDGGSERDYEVVGGRSPQRRGDMVTDGDHHGEGDEGSAAKNNGLGVTSTNGIDTSPLKRSDWRNVTSRQQPKPSPLHHPNMNNNIYNHTSQLFGSIPGGTPTLQRNGNTDSGSSGGRTMVDEEVQNMADSGDLEGLADMVLRGQGDRLLRCRSRLPDVQMFIDNVPTYMAKIKAVHAYAREGSLRGVQTALDRRKFAVSRERGGLTPLHEAVLYGRASVLRYLAARFPETLHCTDLQGRTPLHYAATLPDNGHFYNVLLTLGADKNVLDNFAKTPEHYLKNPGEISHAKLLREFEKGTRSEFKPASANRDDPDHLISDDQATAVIQQGFPVFGAEDGKYLASSVGDPLIKGLSEVAQVRPPEPVIYLANYLTHYATDNNHDLGNGRDLDNREDDLDSDLDHDNGRLRVGESARGERRRSIVVLPDDGLSGPKEAAMTVEDIHRKLSHTSMDADSLDPIDTDNNIHKSPRFVSSPMNRDTTFETSLDDDHLQPGERFLGSGGGMRRRSKQLDEEDEGEFSDKEDNDEEDDEGGGRKMVEGQVMNGSPDQMVKETAFKATTRDEHGQTMLHFAATRAHGRNGMLQLLQEVDCNVALRDELYRTARDVAQQVDIVDNVTAIDRYVVSLAAKGETDRLEELLLEGYNHILDAEDDHKKIVEVAAARGQRNALAFLQSIPLFEERRDLLHRAIRAGETSRTEEILRYHQSSGPTLAVAKNKYGRCSLHIAVLGQHQGIVNHIASRYPQTLHVGDNLMRTPLHYAMGVDKVEVLSRALITAGAQRTVKDLKGRQPSYYFMNKSEIQVLQEEEETFLEQGVEDDLDS